MRRRRLPPAASLVVAGVVGLAIAALAAGPTVHGQTMKVVLAVLAVGVFVAALASLEVALLALIIVAFMDGFTKCLVISPATLLAKDIMLIIALVRWLWMGLAAQRWGALRLPVILPAFLLTLYCIAQMFNTETASPLVALAGLRSWIIWIGVVIVAYEYIRTRAHIERVLVLIMVLALATGIYGIVQYNLGFGHLYRLSEGFDYYGDFTWGTGVRAVSTFVGPGAFGDAMSLSAIFCIGGVMYIRGKQWFKIMLVATAAVCVVAMATSGSRAPLLGLVVGGLSLLVLVRRPQFLFGAIVAGILAVVVLNSFAGGAFEARYNPRMVNYFVVVSRSIGPLKQGLRSALTRPLGVGVATGVGVGRGLDMFGGESIRVKRTAGGMVENEYGRAMRELGIPGFALFLWLLYAVVKMSILSFSRAQTIASRSLIAACLGVIISTLARLAVGSALYLAPSGPLFWLAAAIAVRTADIEAASMEEAYQLPDDPKERDEAVRDSLALR